jgi:hypothetical protein
LSTFLFQVQKSSDYKSEVSIDWKASFRGKENIE